MADGSANQGALVGLNANDFLARLYAGQSLRDVANALGVSRQAVHAWMLRESGDAYHEAITAALVQRVADADERLDEAQDAVDIARAREQARFARMDLERRRPALYGAKPSTAIQVNGADGMSVQIVSFASNNAVQGDDDAQELLPSAP
jgi:hypothetical protein